MYIVCFFQVKTSTPQLKATPVFAIIEPGHTIDLTIQCSLANEVNHWPNPTINYDIGIMVADAPADLQSVADKIKGFWNSKPPHAAIKIRCEFEDENGKIVSAGSSSSSLSPPQEAPPKKAPV